MRKLKILTYKEPIVDSILLRRLVVEGFRICPKMRLADVINTEQGEWLACEEFQYLTRAHFDFVIVKENEPKFAVEFDGSQHSSDPNTIKRDVQKK